MNNLRVDSPFNLAIVGAGPVGLALALYVARMLPSANVTLFDARPVELDVSHDPRTLALSLGSMQLLERLNAWDDARAQPIFEVHVSQQPSGASVFSQSEPELRIRAIDEAVPMLGAVLSYGQIVAPLQSAWLATSEREPQRLRTHFGTPVTELDQLGEGVAVDTGTVEQFDLAVVAEGGVFADQARKSITCNYKQTAWVGQVSLQGGAPGVAYERFTRYGPAALLPLQTQGNEPLRAALVWCVPSDDDPVRELSDAQRQLVLNTIFPTSVGQLVSISPMKHFALGLNAEATLVKGRIVRIGNAAQALHPVAGQGLNLGFRDAFELVRSLRANSNLDRALRGVEWQRAADRWSMIVATDFLARSFTWKLPGLGAARGLGLAALQALRPARSALARYMMFGRR